MDRRSFISGITAASGVTLSAGPAPKETRSVTYAVKGFTCITCAVGLEVMLREQKGVTRANASYPDGKVVIAFASGLTSEKVLKGFIAQCGFSVV